MVMETRDGTLADRYALYMPVPISPFKSEMDYLVITAAGTVYTAFMIPDDGFVWSLCSFTVIPSAVAILRAGISINWTTVYDSYQSRAVSWIPGYQRAVRLYAGQEIIIFIEHMYDGVPLYYYWQLNFWREPKV